MTCAVPGCQLLAADEPVQVKANRHADLEHLPRRRQRDEDEPAVPDGVALAHLCGQHRDEFERLGWLKPKPEGEEET